MLGVCSPFPEFRSLSCVNIYDCSWEGGDGDSTFGSWTTAGMIAVEEEDIGCFLLDCCFKLSLGLMVNFSSFLAFFVCRFFSVN